MGSSDHPVDLTDEELAAECVRRGYRCVRPGDPREAYLFEPPDPDVKTAKEQAVLDAMAAVEADVLRQRARDPWQPTSPDLSEACKAELARRGLK
jgi:hypothetical protein